MVRVVSIYLLCAIQLTTAFAEAAVVTLKPPPLDHIICPEPSKNPLGTEKPEGEVLALFEKVRQALANSDMETLWPLLDSVSQDQADLFAKQVREQQAIFSRGEDNGPDPQRMARRLGITRQAVENLSGKQVWTLPWSLEKQEALLHGTRPRFLPPEIIKSSGREVSQGPFVEIRHLGRRHRIEFALNSHGDSPAYKVMLIPPNHTLILNPNEFISNDYTNNYRSIISAREKHFRFAPGDPALEVTGIYAKEPGFAHVADIDHGHYHLLLFPRGKQVEGELLPPYLMVNGKAEGDGSIVFGTAEDFFGLKQAVWRKKTIQLEFGQDNKILLKRRAPPVSPTMGQVEPGAEILFDGSSIKAWLNAQMHLGEKVMYAATGAETRKQFRSFHLHLEFQNGLDRGKPERSPLLVNCGNWQVRLADTFGIDYDQNGATGRVRPIFDPARHGKQFTRLLTRFEAMKGKPVLVSGEVFINNKRLASSQRHNHCLPPFVWQTLDLFHTSADEDQPARLKVLLNGKSVYNDVELRPSDLPGRRAIQLQGLVPIRNVWISER